MQFGNARIKNAEDDKRHVTFQDVAGADEEKAELEEIVDANGADVTGTMDNKGNVSLTLNGITDNSVTIPQGYHGGSGTVTLNDNIKNEVNSQKTLIQEITSIVEKKERRFLYRLKLIRLLITFSRDYQK